MTYQTKWRGYRNLHVQCNIMICKLLVVDRACAITLSRRKVIFRKVRWSDSSKLPQRENSQICCSPPPHLNVGSHRPPHFKNCPQALLGVLTLKMLVCNNILQWKKPARKTHRAQSRMGLHDEHNFHCVTLLPRGKWIYGTLCYQQNRAT